MTQWQIIIAERGWIYVGKITREGDQVVIREARNVRRWGTTGGLGELALKGALRDTVLDYYGVVRIHVLAVCGAIECNDKIWDEWAIKERKK